MKPTKPRSGQSKTLCIPRYFEDGKMLDFLQLNDQSEEAEKCMKDDLIAQLHQANAGIPTEGAVKHDNGKPELHFLSREMVEAVAEVRSFGAKKYSPNGWKAGFKYSRSISAALRHIMAFNSGEDNDPESGLSHLAHAICCLEHLIHDVKYRPENDDRG